MLSLSLRMAAALLSQVVHMSGVTLHGDSHRDLEDISHFAVEFGVDYVATSRVRSRVDIEELRAFLENIGCENTKVIAKIETVSARV